MRLSEFRTLLREEFGDAYGSHLAASQHLTALGSRTADEALREGTPPREVWLALCAAMEVPAHRHFGKDQPPRRRS